MVTRTSDNGPAAAPTRRTSRLRRAVVVVLALLAAWQIFASFLWIAPPSGVRQLVPGNLLHGYMIPLQGQSWSVFAPAPINGDYRLQVRAWVSGKDDAYATPWVDATAVELTMFTHHLFPPRAAIQSTELASRFKGAYDKLNADHKVIVKLGYFDGDDWQQRLEKKLDSYGAEANVAAYLKQEHMIDAYATQVAYAMWGDDVTRVQWVVSRRNVVPFAERNDDDVERPDPQIALTGWRGLVEEKGQSREHFRQVFRDAYSEVTQ